MQNCKVKLRLGGRVIRRSPGCISNVIRTAIYGAPSPNARVAQRVRRQQATVTGSPRTHVSRRKRRVFNKPPPRMKGFGPIPHPVTPKQFQSFNGPTPAPKPNTRDVATEIVMHNKLRPKAGTFTRADDKKQQSIDALARLKKATIKGFHWTEHMILVLLRVVFGLIVHFNWGYTNAIETTAKLCCLEERSVFKFAKTYMQSDAILPDELPQKVRGRGSIQFISNHGKDRYSKLKEVGKCTHAHNFFNFNIRTHVNHTGASQHNCRVCPRAQSVTERHV